MHENWKINSDSEENYRFEQQRIVVIQPSLATVLKYLVNAILPVGSDCYSWVSLEDIYKEIKPKEMKNNEEYLMISGKTLTMPLSTLLILPLILRVGMVKQKTQNLYTL